MVLDIPNSTICAPHHNTLHVFRDSYFENYVRDSQEAGLDAGSVP